VSTNEEVLGGKSTSSGLEKQDYGSRGSAVSSGYGWRVAVNTLNKQLKTNDKRWSSRLGVWEWGSQPFNIKSML
jgi:hypothetical protein